MVGLGQNRSLQDEKLVEAIFNSHLGSETPTKSKESLKESKLHLIMDARPTANALAQTAMV